MTEVTAEFHSAAQAHHKWRTRLLITGGIAAAFLAGVLVGKNIQQRPSFVDPACTGTSPSSICYERTPAGA